MSVPCGAKADVAVHAYDNDQDTTCNVCSYVRQPMPQEYTVAFDANGGSVSQTSAVTTGGRAGKPAHPHPRRI